MSAFANFGLSLAQGALGGFSNALFGNAASKKQYKYNKSLMELQNQYNSQAATTSFERQMQMWNAQNAYNLPSAQMQRFKDAGLNPNLIYGQNNAAGSQPGAPQSTVSSQHVGAPDYGTNFQNVISTALSLGQATRQNRLLDAERSLKESNIQRNQVSMMEGLARTLNTNLRSRDTSFNLALKRQLRDFTVSNTALMNERNRKMLLNLDESTGLNRINRLYREKEYHDYKNIGIRPNDSFLYRLLFNNKDKFLPGLGTREGANVLNFINKISGLGGY